ncbi:MAG: RDD family protein [Candidatus Limnocylindrales bacterium]
MIDSGGATDQPVTALGQSVRLNERTRRGVLVWIGLGVLAVCVLEFVSARSLIAQGFDWVDLVMLFPIPFVIAIGLVMVGTAAEWTIAGHELRRRSWLSRPGSNPSPVMELGPHFVIVHETRTGWRIRPYGPPIYVARGQATSLTGAMERAGVRVIDWRGDWERRHRLLDRLGLLITLVGAVGMLVTVAQGPLHAVGIAAFWASWGAMMLGFTIDFLPWRMRKLSAQGAEWPQPPAGPWELQTQVGPAPGLAFGGFWLRVVAYLIDMSLLGIVGVVLSSALGAAGQAMGALMFIAYFIGLWGTTGQTVGMMLLGLHVVRDVDGGKITWRNAVLRFVGLFVAFACVYIGVIWVAFDSRKRGWHDKIGATVVVRNVVDGSANATHRLNVRQGATAGIIVSFVAAVSAAGSSTTHLQTFVLALAATLTVTAVVTFAALAINRRAGRPRDL